MKEALKLAREFIDDVYAGEWHGPIIRREQVLEAIDKALAQPEQEPVAWTDKADEWSDEIALHHPFKTKAYKQWDTAMEMVGARHSKGALVELVCWLLQKSTPPQRKPLTDEEVNEIVVSFGYRYDVARAIEAAHGIKE